MKLRFNHTLLDLDLESKTAVFEHDHNTFRVAFDRIIGADGVNSTVREHLNKQQVLQYSRTYLDHGYKELSICQSHHGNMVREHLHLWPRSSFMLLGNPNKDDSITGSLFLSHEGEDSFASIQNTSQLLDFFQKNFRDVIELMPNLKEEFFSNPTGTMSTIQCEKWYYKDLCLLIGDAAHGIIPFFGQGMNCAFEDCRILDESLEAEKDDWSRALPSFYSKRKENTDAVAQMSLGNYHEIQKNIRSPKFNLEKAVEKEIMKRYPKQFITKHVLVMFTNVPYKDAHAVGKAQQAFIHAICQDIESIEDVNWAVVEKRLKDYQRNQQFLSGI